MDDNTKNVNSVEVFGDYAYYYNAFYKDKDYEKEAKDVDLILKRQGKEIKDLIIYGCGTGAHDVELYKLGYSCHGIDMSSVMVGEARKRAKSQSVDIDYEVADIRNYDSEKKYDAVISLFHVMSYQTGNDDIKRAFRSARNSLYNGGVLLFDCWYGPGVLSDPPETRIKEAEDGNNRMIRLCRPIIDESKDTVDVNYEIMIISKREHNMKMLNETHRMRYFFRPEIEEYLSETGFSLVECMDCRTLNKTDFSSWTAYFLAKAV